MKIPALFFFICMTQVIQEGECFPLGKIWEEKGDIVYPRIFHSPKTSRDTQNIDNEMLVIIKAPLTTFYIELYPNKNLLSDDIGNIWNNSERSYFFQGRILSHENGVAGIATNSENGTLSGILILPKEKLIIQPVSSLEAYRKFSWIENDSFPHILYRKSSKYVSENFCNANNYKVGNKTQNKNSSKIYRRKRSDEQYTIELAAFADKDFVDYVKFRQYFDETEVILSIINQAGLILDYGTLEASIKIRVVKIEYEDFSNKNDENIDTYLEKFCHWQSEKEKETKESWDFAVLISGLNMYSIDEGIRNYMTSGTTNIRGMCLPSYSCSVIKGDIFDAGLTLAHEIGHSLSMEHDGVGNNCKSGSYVMSPVVNYKNVDWSPCSNDYLNYGLSHMGYNCLRKEQFSKSPMELDSLFPGEKYPPELQCEYGQGVGSVVYQSSEPPYNNICQQLWCKCGDENPKNLFRPLDGSKCGDKMMCYQGMCVSY